VYYTGFADEAAQDLAEQIRATKELGWRFIEARNINGVNIHDLKEEAFESVADTLGAAGIRINCFGSTVANWSRDPRSEEDWELSRTELKRALPRMKKLDCKMIRGMSFTRLRDASLYTSELKKLIFSRVEELAQMCEEAGVFYMHENCANFGGMSSDHTLELVENIKSPAFKLLFDTGNPINSLDYRFPGTNKRQDAWEFYQAIKEYIAYVHIKDGSFRKLTRNAVFNDSEWTFPGEGDGRVREILEDLLKRGYDGGISIEPHMAVVFHERNSQNEAEVMYKNYVEYGKRLMRLVDNAKVLS
jgi:sugar phosphate isomerase/epimerase